MERKYFLLPLSVSSAPSRGKYFLSKVYLFHNVNGNHARLAAQQGANHRQPQKVRS